MLNNDLYTISGFEDQTGVLNCTLQLNAAHKIFEGHFPGQPVLPGVCMLQIIKELTEKATGKKLFLTEAAQCKFLSMADPVKTPSLIAAVHYRQTDAATITINGTLKSGTATFFKIAAQLTIV